MVGIAVNAKVSAHVGFIGVEIITCGITGVVTFIIMAFETAGLPNIQAAFEIISQVIVSLLVKVVEINVGLFVPVFPPFIFH